MSKQLHKQNLHGKGFSLTEVIIAIALVGAIAVFVVPKFMQQSNVSMSKAKIESNRENIANIVKQADGELGFLPDHMGPAKLLEKYDSYALQDSLDVDFVNSKSAGKTPASKSATPKATKYIKFDGQEIAVSDAVGGCSVAESGDLMDNPNDKIMIYKTPQGVLLTQKYWNTSSGQAKVCITDSIEANSPAKYIVLDRGGKAQTTQVATASTEPTENPNTEPPVTPPVTPPTGTPTTPPTVLTAVFQSSIASVPIPSFKVQLDQCKDASGKTLAGTVQTTVSGGRATFNNTMPQGATSCVLSYVSANATTSGQSSGAGFGNTPSTSPVPGFQTPPSQTIQFSQGNSSYEWITLYPMVTLEVALEAVTPQKCTGDNTSTPPTPPSLSGATVIADCTSTYGNYNATQTTNSQGVVRFSPINPGSACRLTVSKPNYETYTTPEIIVSGGNGTVVQQIPPIPLVSSLSTLVVWSRKYSLYPSPGVDEGPLQGTRVTSSYQNRSVTTDVGGVAVFRDIPLNTSVNLTATQTGYNSTSAQVSMANKCVYQNINMTYMPKGSVTVTVKKYNLYPISNNNPDEGILTSPTTSVRFGTETKTTSAGKVTFSGIPYGTTFQVASAIASGGNTLVDSSRESFVVNAPTRDTTINMGYWPAYSLDKVITVKSKPDPNTQPTPLINTTVGVQSTCHPNITSAKTDGNGKLPLPGTLLANQTCNVKVSYDGHTLQPSNGVDLGYNNLSGKELVLIKQSGRLTIKTLFRMVDVNGNTISGTSNTALNNVVVSVNGVSSNSVSGGNNHIFNTLPYSAYNNNQEYTISVGNLPTDVSMPSQSVKFTFNQDNATQEIVLKKLKRYSVPINTKLVYANGIEGTGAVKLSIAPPSNGISCDVAPGSATTISSNGSGSGTFTGVAAGSNCQIKAVRTGYHDGYTMPFTVSTTPPPVLKLNMQADTFRVMAVNNNNPVLSSVTVTAECGAGATTKTQTMQTSPIAGQYYAQFYAMNFGEVNGPCKITSVVDSTNQYSLDESLPKTFTFNQSNQEISVRLKQNTRPLKVTVKHDATWALLNEVTVSTTCNQGETTSGKTGNGGTGVFNGQLQTNTYCVIALSKSGFKSKSLEVWSDGGTGTLTQEVRLIPETKLITLYNNGSNNGSGSNPNENDVWTIKTAIIEREDHDWWDIRDSLANKLSQFLGAYANAGVTALQMANNFLSTTYMGWNKQYQWVAYNADGSAGNVDSNGSGASGVTIACESMKFYYNGQLRNVDCDDDNPDNIPVSTADNPVYMVNPDGTLYTYTTVFHSPVKLSLLGEKAMLNSTDQFWVDVDGVNKVIEDPFQTSGGLNEEEAWLVLDRDQNGFVHKGLVDGDDVFGDHLGRFVNGYEDLKYTLKPWVKTDKHGEYIELKPLPPGEKLWIALTRLFGFNREYIPSYDLKLLTRSQNVIEAVNVVKRIDVSYKNVEEFDAKKQNVIWQRANVTYLNGKQAESADQWFQKIKGLHQLSPAEVDALIKQGKYKPPAKKAA